MLTTAFLLLSSLSAMAAEVEVVGRDRPLVIFVNGKHVGTTPLVLNLRDGRYSIVAKASPTSRLYLTHDLTVSGQELGSLLITWEAEKFLMEWEDDFGAIQPLEPLDDGPSDLDVLELDYDEPAPATRGASSRYDDDYLLDGIEDLDDPAPRTRRSATREPEPAPTRARDTYEDDDPYLDDDLDYPASREPARPTRPTPTRTRAPARTATSSYDDDFLSDGPLPQQTTAPRSPSRAAPAQPEYDPTESVVAELLSRADAFIAAGDELNAKATLTVAMELAPGNRAIMARLKSMESRPATLTVEMTGVDWSTPPSIMLQSDDGKKYQPSEIGPAGIVFTDLPPEVSFTLRAAGEGYVTAEEPVGVLSSGASGSKEFDLPYLGTAEVEFADWAEGTKIRVSDASGRRTIGGPGVVPVLAGEVSLQIESPLATREASLDLARGTLKVISLADILPSKVNLRNVPAGSTLDFVEGPTRPDRVTVSRSTGTEQDGIRVARSIPIEDLKPGTYVVEVSHPSLGLTRTTVETAPGQAVDHALTWENMTNTRRVKAARQEWEKAVAASEKTPLGTKLGRAAGAVSVGLLGASGYMATRAMAAGGRQASLDDEYQAALDDSRFVDAWDTYASMEDTRDAQQGALLLTGAGLGLTGVGAAVTVIGFQWGKKSRVDVPPWDLYEPYGLSPSSPVASKE